MVIAGGAKICCFSLEAKRVGELLALDAEVAAMALSSAPKKRTIAPRVAVKKVAEVAWAPAFRSSSCSGRQPPIHVSLAKTTEHAAENIQ